MIKALSYKAVVIICCVFAQECARAEDTLIELQAGEVRVLAIPQVARIAVGDGHVINAVTTDEKEVIVFARHEGASALHIWSEDGRRQRYLVEVAAEGARRTQQELLTVLERIPSVRVFPVGDKLLIEGDDLSDVDRDRIAALAQRYPQLLDFTGQVGWDRMVLLNVRVIELPRHSLHELGVRWSSSSEGGLTTGLAWDAGSGRLLDRPGETVVAIPHAASPVAGYFGVNAFFSAHIQAMAQQGQAVVLAEPQLLARSGAVAEFLAGGEVPYATVDANGNTHTVFKPYGVSLRITPRIERNNAVRSRIEVEVSSVDTAHAGPNGPALRTRRAATEFNVQSGQTLVLAGFLSREAAQNQDAVPGLGRLPLIGSIFRSQRKQEQDSELAIFVTPVVVTPHHPSLQERAQRADSIVAANFPTPPQIHTAIMPSSGSSQNNSAVDPAPFWDPWHGRGSQWSQPPATQAAKLASD